MDKSALETARVMVAQVLAQIQYRVVAVLLILIGVALTTWGKNIPWVWCSELARELGPGIFTAGILALVVEPHFKKEFARDAFLAAFSYVLPQEFRDEAERILREEFICEKQLWTVRVDNCDQETVLVTTSFERILRNKTSLTRKKAGLYTIPEFNFHRGPARIIECGIEGKEQTLLSTNPKKKGHYWEATTKEIDVPPNETVKVFGKAVQYRRHSDLVYETFGTPAINPEIEVIIPDDFDYVKEFGTPGSNEKARYKNVYKLTGVYFPGRYMLVQWWPKSAAADTQASST
jgi:hypothetical protein